MEAAMQSFKDFAQQSPRLRNTQSFQTPSRGAVTVIVTPSPSNATFLKAKISAATTKVAAEPPARHTSVVKRKGTPSDKIEEQRARKRTRTRSPAPPIDLDDDDEAEPGSIIKISRPPNMRTVVAVKAIVEQKDRAKNSLVSLPHGADGLVALLEAASQQSHWPGPSPPETEKENKMGKSEIAPNHCKSDNTSMSNLYEDEGNEDGLKQDYGVSPDTDASLTEKEQQAARIHIANEKMCKSYFSRLQRSRWALTRNQILEMFGPEVKQCQNTMDALVRLSECYITWDAARDMINREKDERLRSDINSPISIRPLDITAVIKKLTKEAPSHTSISIAERVKTKPSPIPIPAPPQKQSTKIKSVEEPAVLPKRPYVNPTLSKSIEDDVVKYVRDFQQKDIFNGDKQSPGLKKLPSSDNLEPCTIKSQVDDLAEKDWNDVPACGSSSIPIQKTDPISKSQVKPISTSVLPQTPIQGRGHEIPDSSSYSTDELCSTNDDYTGKESQLVNRQPKTLQLLSPSSSKSPPMKNANGDVSINYEDSFWHKGFGSAAQSKTHPLTPSVTMAMPSPPTTVGRSVYSPPCSPSGRDEMSTSDNNGSVCSDNLASNTVGGAISSLRPDQWLSCSAIGMTLSRFANLCSSSVHVMDGAYIDTSNPLELKSKSSLEAQGATAFIVPLQFPSHWALGHVDIGSQTINFYDSCKAVHYGKIAELSLRWFVEHLARSQIIPQQVEWKFVEQTFPQQENTNDCGIFCILAAIHLLADASFPQSISNSLCRLWRLIATAVISDDNPRVYFDYDIITKDLPLGIDAVEQRVARLQDLKDETTDVAAMVESVNNLTDRYQAKVGKQRAETSAKLRRLDCKIQGSHLSFGDDVDLEEDSDAAEIMNLFTRWKERRLKEKANLETLEQEHVRQQLSIENVYSIAKFYTENATTTFRRLSQEIVKTFEDEDAREAEDIAEVERTKVELKDSVGQMNEAMEKIRQNRDQMVQHAEALRNRVERMRERQVRLREMAAKERKALDGR